MTYCHHPIRILFILSVLLLSACGSQPSHRVHYRLVEGQATLPSAGKPILLLAMDVEVSELSAGGLLDVVPSWTKEARQRLRAALEGQQGELLAGAHLVDLPALSDEERQRVDEHLALNETVAADALTMTGPIYGSKWQHKLKHFDYTIGPGLAFLADKTGADQALILIGRDIRTSSGRQAAFIALALLGVGIPMGQAVTFADVIDLRSGDILWLNRYFFMSGGGYSTDEHAQSIVRELFKPYPGVDEYRKFANGLR